MTTQSRDDSQVVGTRTANILSRPSFVELPPMVQRMQMSGLRVSKLFDTRAFALDING